MSKMGRLYNYDDDPADASLVESWLQHKRDSEYDDMADEQGKGSGCISVRTLILVVIAVIVLAAIVMAIQGA